MKRVSIYIKGGQNSPSYYRIYQYTNALSSEFKFEIHDMLTDKLLKKYTPISRKSLTIKIWVYSIIYWRILFSLFRDCIYQPDTLIITRCIIPTKMPLSFRIMLSFLRRKVKIIWDFDDDIIEGREVSRKTFNYLSNISSKIFCTHNYLYNLIEPYYRDKVEILPTTDGDMYKMAKKEDVRNERLSSLNKCIRMVWVATSVNLYNLKSIAPFLDRAAIEARKMYGRQLELEVICDKPLNHNFLELKLFNTRWTREDAIKGIRNAHIGIMPLVNTTYTKGKGGFKLVQYLSFALPCIGSNVGYNKTIINPEVGFLATSESEWIHAILTLSNVSKWEKYSEQAFTHWNSFFSFEHNLARWKDILK